MRRDVFQAIADPTRREIIALLTVRPLTMNAVAGKFKTSRPAISKHMRILRECGLIEDIKHGREIYSRTKAHKLKEVADWVEFYKVFWDQKLHSLKKFLEEEK